MLRLLLGAIGGVKCCSKLSEVSWFSASACFLQLFFSSCPILPSLSQHSLRSTSTGHGGSKPRAHLLPLLRTLVLLRFAADGFLDMVTCCLLN